MTGVCAGDKRKVKLGDLIVANCAFAYNGSAVDNRQRHQCNIGLYQTNIDLKYCLRAFDTWRQWVRSVEPDGNSEFSSGSPLYPDFHITAMASVSAVRRDDPFHDLQSLVSESIAMDMESASFYRTAASLPGLHSLVVKGVCDYADEKKSDEYHEYASKISAVYMLCFIQEYVTSDLTSGYT